jgi:hypothetical protein
MKSKAPKKEGYSIGYLRFAKEYKAAAETLVDNPQGLFFVTYYLFCHALELLIKAYLKAVGFGEDDLKTKYRHNLEKLLQEAQNNGLDKYVSLSGSEVEVISQINAYYKNKELEYLILGFKFFPPLNELKSVLDRLCNIIEPLCKKNSALKAKKQIEAKKSLKPSPA